MEIYSEYANTKSENVIFLVLSTFCLSFIP